MKRFIVYVMIGSFLFTACAQEEPISKVIERGFTVSNQQAIHLAKELENQEGRLPRTYEDGKLKTADCKSWISGFFPGVLWYLYENNPTEELKTYAEQYTERVEPAKTLTSHHDLGFMLYCSFGNGYRLTGNPHYLDVMKIGAESLATRYNDTVKSIKSWNKRGVWEFPVIIDNMMNLEFFTFMTKETGDKKYEYMANAHATTTLKNHFRPDYSSYHVVSYHPKQEQSM